MIGKRKRETTVVTRSKTITHSDHGTISPNELNTKDRLRQHFEAQFEPLPVTAPENPLPPNVITDSDDESEWSGLSDTSPPEPPPTVKIIEHRVPPEDKVVIDRTSKKPFMSSKPPRCTDHPTNSKPQPQSTDDTTDSLNLHHDQALHRLLQESHLLNSSPNLHRQKTDLRLQALGFDSKVSMPMSHRKGMASKRDQRETQRRQESRENGVVLERRTVSSIPKREKGSKIGRGDRPAVGRLVDGATLRLSRRDVRSIQGSDTNEKKGRGGRRQSRGRR